MGLVLLAVVHLVAVVVTAVSTHITKRSRGTARGEFGLNLGIGVYGGKLQFGGGALLPLNAALCFRVPHV
ncbi:hypothetical protein ACSTLL_00780 [Vibrio parahaemolyticus]